MLQMKGESESSPTMADSTRFRSDSANTRKAENTDRYQYELSVFKSPYDVPAVWTNPTRNSVFCIIGMNAQLEHDTAKIPLSIDSEAQNSEGPTPDVRINAVEKTADVHKV